MIPEALSAGDILRVYDPETLEIMTAAFERACQFLPPEHRRSASARRRVALRIIRIADQGERDPVRLAHLVIVVMCR